MHADSVHQEHGIGRALLAELINQTGGLDRWAHVTLVQLVEARG
ncbi:MAG TPA: hypothetical protein VND96_15210 [Candidatus Micrarchaeaceae archaeon]|nr:hypothetical protein [Candidatus Micrarchaeaceae archaeon]